MGMSRRGARPAKTDAQQTFVRNLRWAQKELGLTLWAMAERANVERDWLRRVATQGLQSPKKAGKAAVEKLEAFLGCPSGTLWERDGLTFQAGVKRKHSGVDDPVADFAAVYRHYGQSPTPILTQLIDLISHLRRSIDDPSIESPRDLPRAQPEDSVAVVWTEERGWTISEAALKLMDDQFSVQVKYCDRIGLQDLATLRLNPEAVLRQLPEINLFEIEKRAFFEGAAAILGTSAEEASALISKLSDQHKARLVEEKRERLEEEKARADAEVAKERAKDQARQEARSHAPVVMASLSPDEQAWYAAECGSRIRALKGLEQELYEQLWDEHCGRTLTIDQAVEVVRAAIRRDFSGGGLNPQIMEPRVAQATYRQAHERVPARAAITSIPAEHGASAEPSRPTGRTQATASLDTPAIPQQVASRIAAAPPPRPAPPPTMSQKAATPKPHEPAPASETARNDLPTGSELALIKWTGGKLEQARHIVARFPRRIRAYYEPFLGGGSVLYELLGTDIHVDRYEVSDECEPLIGLWKIIQDDPAPLLDQYAKDWALLQANGEDYYNEVRDRFNRDRNPIDLFFLTRTCRLGRIRFNRSGEFNVNYHEANPGMAPETVRRMADDWQFRLVGRDITFSVRDYREVTPRKGDLIYIDPPYKTGEGRYYAGPFDHSQLFRWVRRQPCSCMMSLNGFVGDQDRRVDVPDDLFDEHVPIVVGDSKIDRIAGRGPRQVTETLYIKRQQR